MMTSPHRRRSWVNDTTFLPEKYVWKINKIPDFLPENADFYIIIARKIFFPDFFFLGGGARAPCPLLLRLCLAFPYIQGNLSY